jgi:hypothetical protein
MPPKILTPTPGVTGTKAGAEPSKKLTQGEIVHPMMPFEIRTIGEERLTIGPFQGYSKYSESMLWCRDLTTPQPNRDKILLELQSMKASCFHKAVAYIATVVKTKAHVAANLLMGESQIRAPVSLDEAVGWVQGSALDAHVYVIVSYAGAHNLYRHYTSPVGLAAKGLALVLFDDAGVYAPHWLPVTSVNERARIKLNKQEVKATAHFDVNPQFAFDWLVYLKDLKAGLVQLDLGPEGEQYGPQEQFPPEPVVEEPMDLEGALDECFWTPEHNYELTVADMVNAFTPSALAPEHVPDYTGLSSTQVVGVNKTLVQCYTMVGIHAFPMGSLSRFMVDSVPTFHYVGSSTHLPATTGCVERGFPTDFELHWAEGLSRKYSVLWELHPDVISGIRLADNHLVYVQMEEPKMLDPRFLANGCYNPEFIGELITEDGVYDIVDPLDVVYRNVNYRVFRLDRRCLRAMGILRQLIPGHLDELQLITLHQFNIHKLPTQESFDSKRSWLRCVFNALAGECPPEIKSMVIEQRNLALGALEEGSLPDSYDPVAVTRAVSQMRTRVAALLDTKGETFQCA